MRKLIASGTERMLDTVIPGLDGPAPASGGWIAVSLITSDREGVPWQVQDGQNTTTKVNFSVMVNVDFMHSKTAISDAMKFIVWLSSPDGRAAQKAQDTVLYRTSGPRNLSKVFPADWEGRAQVDLHMGVEITIDAQDTGQVDTVEVCGTVDVSESDLDLPVDNT